MNFFNELNINQNSNKEQIKKAYIKLVFKHHPDRGGKASNFIDILNTYEYLIKNCENKQQTNNNTNYSNNSKNNYSNNSTNNQYKQETNTNDYNQCNNKNYSYNYKYKEQNINFTDLFNRHQIISRVQNLFKMNIPKNKYFNKYTFIFSIPFIDNNINKDSTIVSRFVKFGIGYVIWPISISVAIFKD
jgi:DnaJ-class molecular chaperone